jgi:hypothetical protein
MAQGATEYRAFVNTVMKLRFHNYFLNSWTIISISIKTLFRGMSSSVWRKSALQCCRLLQTGCPMHCSLWTWWQELCCCWRLCRCPQRVRGPLGAEKYSLVSPVPRIPLFVSDTSISDNLLLLLAYIYFRQECNVLSCPTSLWLHVSTVHGHHQVDVYLAKVVSLYVKITYRVWTRCWLLIKIYLRLTGRIYKTKNNNKNII